MSATAVTRSVRSAWGRMPVVLVSALALAIAAPMMRSGYVLLTDQVATPRSFLVPDSWGVGDAVPRAVPLDALTALLTTVVDGQYVQKLLLLLALLLSGWGAAALVPTDSVAVRCVAGVLYLWNPYVAERLIIGHWALLCLMGLRHGSSGVLSGLGPGRLEYGHPWSCCSRVARLLPAAGCSASS